MKLKYHHFFENQSKIRNQVIKILLKTRANLGGVGADALPFSGLRPPANPKGPLLVLL